MNAQELIGRLGIETFTAVETAVAFCRDVEDVSVEFYGKKPFISTAFGWFEIRSGTLKGVPIYGWDRCHNDDLPIWEE